VPDFAVDSPRQPMLSTGISNPAMEWGQNGEKRFKTDTQERNPNTGMPIWEVEVMYTGVNFGQECTITANVTVGAAEKPQPSPLTPITFTGLRVSVYKNKAGGLTENWSAEAIADMTDRPAAKADTSTSASSSGSSSSGSSSKSSSGGSASAA
jgi:hypothetical protein